MGNVIEALPEYDEFYDEYYSTVCPNCNENNVGDEEPICGSCALDEMATSHEDAGFEMWLGLE
jgi:hypothetical protein